MSASREKRNRQNDTSLTEKQQLAEQTAAAAKKKTRLYTVIAVIVAVAVAALLIWDSGVFRKDSTAMVINGREYSASEVSYYYTMSRQQYSYYLQYFGYDSSLSDRSQIYDSSSGQTYYDLFMEGAKVSMIRVAALADAARAEGMELDALYLADVNNAMATYENYAVQYGYDLPSYLKLNFGEFMTKEVLLACMKEDALASKYYATYADSLSYDLSDLTAYYEEHAKEMDTFRFDLCFVNGLLSGDDVTEEQKTAAMDLAKSEATKLLNATDFSVEASLIANKSESSFYNEDLASVGTEVGSLYLDWLADDSRKDGDVELFESASGYYVVRFHDRYLDENAPGNVDIRHILIKAEVEEGASAPTEEALALAKAEAEAVLDTFLSGEQTGLAFGKLAEEYSDDPGSNGLGGLYTGVTPSTSFFTEFLDWIFADGREVGDTGLVENPQSGQQGWHVMYLDSINQSLWQLTAEEALETEALDTWVNSKTEGYTAEETSGIKLIG